MEGNSLSGKGTFILSKAYLLVRTVYNKLGCTIMDVFRSTLQKERLTVHGFGNRISCAFVNAALPYKSVCKYCVHKLQTAVSL